jgi:hypothetical protein
VESELAQTQSSPTGSYHADTDAKKNPSILCTLCFRSNRQNCGTVCAGPPHLNMTVLVPQGHRIQDPYRQDPT